MPKHDGGGDEIENLILLSLQDHFKAHALRYEVYGQKGDRWCVGFMGKNVNPEAYVQIRREAAFLSHAVQKRKRVGFFPANSKRKMRKKV